MSDTLRCYRAIHHSLHQLLPTSATSPEKPQGRLARTLDTLAWLITGIVRSESSQLPSIASHMPDAQRESQVKKLSRWVKNEKVDERCGYLTFSEPLLKALVCRMPRIVLVIDCI